MSNPNKMKFLRYFFRKFPRAIEAVAEIAKAGDEKHNGTVRSFLDIENGHQEYTEAMFRHILAEIIEGPIDSEDGRLHAARIAWGALARLEIQLEEVEGAPVDYQYEGGPIGEARRSSYGHVIKPPVKAGDVARTPSEACCRDCLYLSKPHLNYGMNMCVLNKAPANSDGFMKHPIDAFFCEEFLKETKNHE